MKRYHPYYLAVKSNQLEHHFRVGASNEDYNTVYFGWDGQKLTFHNSWFGSPERCPSNEKSSSNNVPSELSEVIPLLKQAYLDRSSERFGVTVDDIGIAYDGHFSKHRVNKYILLDHDQLPEDLLKEKEIYAAEEWDYLMDYTTIIAIDAAGNCRVLESMWGDGPSYARFSQAPVLVYDYFTPLDPKYCISGKDTPKGFGYELNFVDSKTMTISDPELVKVIQEQKILPLAEYNAKYGLEPEVGLETFRRNKPVKSIN